MQMLPDHYDVVFKHDSGKKNKMIYKYKVKGCEECKYNGTFFYVKTTENGDVWWENEYHNALRFSPGWGWSLGWYTHSSKHDIAPTNGWTFNGGRCDPSTLGENIVITK